MAIQRELPDKEDKYVTAETLKALGDTHHHLGNYLQAVDYHRQALELDRQLGDHYSEAGTLTRLGDAYQGAAEPDAAQNAWRQAAAILDDLHHPDAALIFAKLSELPPR